MVMISVVIPTRDRAHLLEQALASALAQEGFDDYEVVVSDNGTDGRAAALLAGISDPRLRVVQTGGALDVYQSWNFALRAARGRYHLLLADDDSLLPDGLQLIKKALARWDYPQYLGLASGWYSAPSRQQPPRNALRFDLDWSKEGPQDPREMLADFFCFGRPSFSPTYVLVDRSVREALWARGVEPYLPAYPDFAFNAMALGLVETAAVMRAPVLLHGYTPESLGENAFGRRERVAWAPPQGEPHIFRLSPLRGYVFVNGWLETLLRCQEALPDVLGAVPIPWAGFVQTYVRGLYEEGHWRDVRPDMEEVSRFIKELPAEARVALLQEIGGLLKRLQRLAQVRAWEQVQGQREPWWDGARYGFEDIVGCAGQARALYAQAARAQAALRFIQEGQGGTP